MIAALRIVNACDQCVSCNRLTHHATTELKDPILPFKYRILQPASASADKWTATTQTQTEEILALWGRTRTFRVCTVGDSKSSRVSVYAISYDSKMNWLVDALAGKESHKTWVTVVELWRKSNRRFCTIDGMLRRGNNKLNRKKINKKANEISKKWSDMHSFTFQKTNLMLLY